MNKPSQAKPKRVMTRGASAQRGYVSPGERLWMRRVARGMAAFLLCQGTWFALPALAQVTPSAEAPAGQRPIMDAAQNGVPIVHIAPPSAGGVSHNQYDQFNTGTNGLILNNSAAAVQTQQGGWITGNLQLGPTPARVILNEVVGADRSQLRGTIEIAGQRADIVVANPNGITCDGCGFLNTGRASLTTGRPQFNGDGSIRGFDVRQGQLTVGGNGLNASNLEQLDLIARGIVIEGEVWAKNLNVIAGANQVLYGTLQSVAQGASGPAPQFAIDIKDLGGMYANQVYLISNERGVGVNSTGRMAALQGNLVLSANGDLSLKDTYAKQNVQVNGGNIALNGQTQSEGKSTIAAAGTLTNSGSIDSQDALALSAASLTNSGSIAQRNDQGASIAATGDVANTGAIYSDSRVSFNAATLNNRTGHLAAGHAVTIQVAAVDNTDGQIGATNAVTIASVAAINNTRGTIVSNGDLALAATSLNNQSGIASAQQTASVQLGNGLLDNTQGKLIGSQSLVLQSGPIHNDAGTIASGAALSLDTQGAELINTNGGQIVASGDLTIASARLDNTNGTAASLVGQLGVDTTGHQLANDGGKLQAAGNTTIAAGNVSNQNGLISGVNIAATTSTLNNDAGQVAAGGTLALATQALSNDHGLLQSVGNAQIDTNGQSLGNTNSGSSGGIVSGGTLAVNAGSVNNQAGYIASGGNQAMTVTGDLDNRAAGGRAGQIVSNGDATLTAANVLNQGGRISALGNTTLATGLLGNRAGTIDANGAVQLNATIVDNRAQDGTAGTVDAADIGIAATTIDNGGGAIRANNNATLVSTSLDNTGGTLTAKNNLSLTSVGMANFSGRMVGDQGVTVTTSSQTLGGTIASSHDVALNINGDYNNSSLLSAQQDLTVNATNITNSGTLTAGQTLTANTGNLTNSGEISGQNVALNETGTLTNTSTGLIDAVDTRVNADTVDNSGRIYGDALRVNARTINNNSTGAIAARGTLLIGAQQLNNTGGGLVYSLGDMTIGGSIDGNGQVQGAMTSLTNGSSKIESTGNMTIASATILNRNDNLTTNQVADAPVYQEKVQPRSSATQYPGAQCTGIGGGQDDNSCIVHPDKYGLRSTITPVFSQDCQYGSDGLSQDCTTRINYSWNDPVFTTFQVATAGAPPTEPAGGCSYSNPLTDTVEQVNSSACNQWRSDFTVWQTAYYATLTQLDAKVSAYNAEVNEDNRTDHFEDYTWYKLTSAQTHTVVANTDPGQILAGSNMALAGQVTNRDSQIVAGAALAIDGPAVDNIATQGEERTDFSGTSQFTEVVSCGSFGGSHCRHWYAQNPYNLPPITVMADLPTVRYEQYAGNQASIRTLAAGTGTADTSVANAALLAVANNRTAGGVVVQAAMTDSAPVTMTVPDNSLFVTHPEPSSRYLVETDPRFTSYRNFISSDYFLQALDRDPERQMKRYGDGFMEQQLVNDQVLALTGRRYLDGYSSTEAEYKGLMEAGVAFAEKYQLSPGVALSAEQMALLTTDIVLLVPRTVKLADGSTQQVLAPQVYLRRPMAGDLQPNGALIAGNDVLIQTQGDLTNSGTITGKTMTATSGGDLVNQGGRISGQNVFLRANNDLKNLSGVIQGAGTDSSVALLAGRDIVLQTQTLGTVNNDGSGTRITTQRIATVQGGNIRLDAGRDLIAQGAAVGADHDLFATAGRDITVAAVANEYQLNVKDKSGMAMAEHRNAFAPQLTAQEIADGKQPEVKLRRGYVSESATTNQLASFSAGNQLAIIANNNVAVKGADIAAGTSGTGDALVQGRNVSIEAVTDSTATDIQTIGKKSYDRVARESETAVSGSITAAGNVTVSATGRDAATGTVAAQDGNLTITGGYVSSQNGQVALAANNNVSIGQIATRQRAIDDSYAESSSLINTTTTNHVSDIAQTRVNGSNITGNSIVIAAGDRSRQTGDVTVVASNIVADHDVTVAAGRNVAMSSAQETTDSQQLHEVTQDGIFGSSGGFTWGSQVTSQRQTGSATRQVGSAVASLGGNVGIDAGNQYSQTASQVAALGDVDIAAKKIDINAATETNSSLDETKFDQSGLSVGASSPLLSALDNVEQVSDETGKAKDGRIKALGALSTVLATMKAAQAAQQAASSGSVVDVSITVGDSHSESQQHQSGTTAVGSTVKAGGNLTLSAQGDGKASDITIVGSDLDAGHNASLKADGAIDVLAATNTAEQHSTNSSSSSGVGVAISIGRGGAAFGVTANASAARGNADGSDVSYTNSHVNAGNQLALASGGDTTVRGGVVSGRQVAADVGGNLNIESLQDTSVYKSKDQSIGGSVTAGYGFAMSASASRTKINADYANVAEQSGIAAGDDGFNIKVKGNTDLKGGAIASSQAAVDHNRNRFATGTLTQSDLVNKAEFDASSISLSGSFSASSKGAPGKEDAGKEGSAAQPGKSEGMSTSVMNFGNGRETSAGFGSDSGSDTGVTRSGISGGALAITDSTRQKALTGKTVEETTAGINRDIVSGQDSGAVAKNWDAQAIQDNVQAQARIVQAFAPMAAKAVGDYAQKKLDESQALRLSAESEADPLKRAALLQRADDLESAWKEGGPARVALHTAVGALAGGSSGALGAGAGAAAAPAIAEEINKLDVPGELKTTLIAIADTAVGGVTGGTAGAASGLNEVANNYLKHNEAIALRDKLYACKGDASCVGQVKREALALSEQNSAALKASCAAGFDACMEAYRAAKAGYNWVEPLAYQTAAPELGSELLQIQQQDMAYAYQRAQAMFQGMPIGTARAKAAADLYGPDLAAGLIGLGAARTASAVGGVPEGANSAGGLGKVTGNFSAIEPGPLAAKYAETFAGGRYTTVTLQNDTVLYRAGTASNPLGEYFSLEPPTGVLQTRIDKAVLPEWPSGAKSPIDTSFAVKIPAGTQVHVGQVGAQSGFYVGGTQQIVIPKPWTINGVQVINSSPLK